MYYRAKEFSHTPSFNIATVWIVNDLYKETVIVLRNGPDKNDSNNGNEHVGMQKRC